MAIKKVRWHDGDVISEKHFTLLEEWIESTQKLMNQSFNGFGFFRPPANSHEINDLDKNILLSSDESGNYKVTIQNTLALTPEGTLIYINLPREFNLGKLRPQQVDNFKLYIFAGEIEREEQSHKLTGDPVLYDLAYKCKISSFEDKGLCIGIVKSKRDTIELDPEFIPYGINLFSTIRMITIHDEIINNFENIQKRFDDYFKKIAKIPGFDMIREFAKNEIRLINYLKSELLNKFQSFNSFLYVSQKFFDSLVIELKILEINYVDMPNRMSVSLQKFCEQYSGIHLAGDASNESGAHQVLNFILKGLNQLEVLLSEFPGSAALESDLGIESAKFSKKAEDVYNELTIEFKEEYSWEHNDSIVIYLTDFAEAAPLNFEIRIAPELNAVYAQLYPFNDLLKMWDNDKSSYTIECPKNLIHTDKLKHLTIFLPSPLGENVDDVKANIRCQFKQNLNSNE